MNRLHRVHSADDVAEDLGTALAIVEDLQPPNDLRQAVFQFAAQLVTQRVIEQTPTVPLHPALVHPPQRRQ